MRKEREMRTLLRELGLSFLRAGMAGAVIVAALGGVAAWAAESAASGESGAAAESAESAPVLSRGAEWVRSHPFTIMGLTIVERPFDVELYRKAGFSSLLAWKPRDEILRPAAEAGLPWHQHLYVGTRNSGPFSEENREEMRRIARQYPGGIGWLINDEPGRGEDMEVTAEVVDWLRGEFPEMLAYSNANPASPWSEGRMLAFARIIRPDVLMYDRYPFDKPGATSRDFFWNMAYVRGIALVQGVPYWGFVQAYEDRRERGTRLPSESDLRMQVSSMLAYGYSGIAYFMYDLGPQFQRGVLELDGSPSRLYEPAAKLNPEVANLGRCLKMLTSTSVHYVPAEGAQCPTGTTPWQSRMMRVETPGCDGLIGWFRDDEGGRYFMLVNLTHGPEMSAQEGTAAFRIRFRRPGTDLYRLDRMSGRAQRVALETDEEMGSAGFTLRLPGGTGDLFKIGDARFAGIDEPGEQQ